MAEVTLPQAPPLEPGTAEQGVFVTGQIDPPPEPSPTGAN
jgi:hypothetical protein